MSILEVYSISNISLICNLVPSYSVEDAKSMLVERRGTKEDAFMLTGGLHCFLDSEKIYRLLEIGVKEVVDAQGVKNINELQ